MTTVRDADRLRELLDVIVASLDEPGLTGDDVAGRAFLSRFHFDRRVSAEIGEAPGAFRRRLLLERAAWQLSGGRVSVTAAAIGAGYGSPEAFSRAFRRAFGASPSGYRGGARGARPGRRPARLKAPNGIHFHPPGGLRLPALRRRFSMDVLTSMAEHDSWLIEQMLDRADGLAPEVLDQPITISADGLDSGSSLRGLLTHLVWQKEMWTAAVEGRPAPDGGASSIADLRRRHAVSGPGFVRLAQTMLADGRAGDTFIDATCDPPLSFSFGGMIAHVLTFSAYRRTLALAALDRAGVTDLGFGDPSGFVADGPPD